MDDLQSNLESYYLQLQQVNAALTTDPSNEELLKLKTDLQEVIDLTQELASPALTTPGGKVASEHPVSSPSVTAGGKVASTSSMNRVTSKETFAQRKQALQKQKEYLKKRKQKKLARIQEQEADREKVKKKWLNFSAKKGLMNKKKSIFASPETVDGRVGVGTCGVAGKGMTEFSQADKWRKGWKH